MSELLERNDLLVNFDPDYRAPNGRRGRFVVPSQETLANIDARIINYGVVTADQVGVGRGLVKTDTNNLAPRLGAAWRLTDKSVIRGGWGLFYPTSAAQGMRDALATKGQEHDDEQPQSSVHRAPPLIQAAKHRPHFATSWRRVCLLREWVRAHLEMYDLAGRPLAAFGVPHGARPVARPHTASLPAGRGVIDAGVHATLVEAKRIRHA